MGNKLIVRLFFTLTFLIAATVQAEEMSLDHMMLLHDLDPKGEILTKESPAEASNGGEAATLISIADSPKPIRLLIDVRSNHSDGQHDFQTLTSLAKSRAIDAMAFTEHDRYSIRFGIDPVPYLFGYSMEHPSLHETGVEKFFSDLDGAKKQTNITLFAGTESTPGYYWEGIPFRNLTLHQAEKHLITLGATTPSQIESLPSYELKHAYGNHNLSLLFWLILFSVLMFRLLRKRRRNLAMLLAGSFVIFMASWLMQPEVDPYEDFIAKAQEQGLFVIWTHPGTLSGIREGAMGVQLNTPPYNQDVFAKAADAFAAVYGDTDNNTAPAGAWDRYMMQYLAGDKEKPIWAVATGDYHEEGMANEYLGNYPMDVWAESAKEKDILAALKQGRMVAWQMQKQHHIAASALFLEFSDPETLKNTRIYSGDKSVVPDTVHAVFAVHNLKAEDAPLHLQGHWVVDGKIVADVNLSTEQGEEVESTTLNLPRGHHVVRFQIPSQQGIRMESNPFLLQVH